MSGRTPIRYAIGWELVFIFFSCSFKLSHGIACFHDKEAGIYHVNLYLSSRIMADRQMSFVIGKMVVCLVK